MNRIEVQLPVAPERAFTLLEYPRSFRAIVPGARPIRYFDPSWPDPGTEVRHSVGVYPLVIRDRTIVMECQPGRRLVLEARVQMIGTFVVDFRFEPDAGGTRLTVEETVMGGALGLPLLRPLADLTVRVRNAELARRLRRLSDARESARGGRAGA
jgi:hypothetical protein